MNILHKLILEELDNLIKPQITYQVNTLKHFLDFYQGIKQLRVPSWYLQVIYKAVSDEPKADEKFGVMACVAFEGKKPIGIVTLKQMNHRKLTNGSMCDLNVYVDSWHRKMGISTAMLKKIEPKTKEYRYVMVYRSIQEMLERRGYTESKYKSRSGGKIFLNPNWDKKRFKDEIPKPPNS